MLYSKYPKEVVLKDGTEVTLRPIQAGDLDLLLAFYRGIPAEERIFFKEDPADPGVIQQWLKGQSTLRSFGVIGVLGERIVAHSALFRRDYGVRKHLAKIRVMVDPGHRAKRLGTWMIFDLMKRALELGLEVLVAELVKGVEEQAIDGLRKLGFIEQCVIKTILKDHLGKTYDLVIMTKELQTEWGDF